MKEKRRRGGKRRIVIIVLIVLLLVIPLFFGWSTQAPAGTSFEGPAASVSQLEVLYDLSYLKDNEQIHDQNILDAQIKMIEAAAEFVVADLFLYNEYYNTAEYDFPASTRRFTEALVAQKQKYPDLKAYLITDEINNSYNATLSDQFQLLEESGVEVIVTDLSRVRDSNPLYAGYFRAYLQHFGQCRQGWITNPFGDNGPQVGVRSFLRLLNFKANHRKVLITDQGAMISSANPHDGSSYHSNIAFQFSGEAVTPLLEAEKAVAAFSGAAIEGVKYQAAPLPARENTSVQVLTEDKIKDKILENIKSAEAGDRIDLGMFYLAHRELLSQLILAAQRGAEVRLVLDPNKDAFGFEKNGIPNRQAAAELVEKSEGKIQVRWYLTHGEQFHTKVIAFHKGDSVVLIGGSANYTRRNLDNYNLEADLMVTIGKEDPIAKEFSAYFDRIWGNQDGLYTADFSEYADDSLWKKAVYRLQESTGLCTF